MIHKFSFDVLDYSNGKNETEAIENYIKTLQKRYPNYNFDVDIYACQYGEQENYTVEGMASFSCEANENKIKEIINEFDFADIYVF